MRMHAEKLFQNTGINTPSCYQKTKMWVGGNRIGFLYLGKMRAFCSWKCGEYFDIFDDILKWVAVRHFGE